MNILTPAISLGTLALFLGAVLAVASHIFKVETDERIEKITNLLPGANCGGCSYAGCTQFAKAIIDEGVSVTLCHSVSAASADEINEILGKEKEKVVPKKAVVLCSKTENGTALKYKYYGITDCFAAQRISGGPNGCKYGCIGFGSCAAYCPQNVISIKGGLAVIDENVCTGCGGCVKQCPANVLELVPRDTKIYVKCKNADKGSETRKVCESGCISCGICEKNCPDEAIKLNGVAKIDYAKCTSCGICAEKCPKKVIKA